MADTGRLNNIIRAWEQGRPAFASFAHADAQTAIELSTAPYDGIIFEMEHNPFDVQALQDAIWDDADEVRFTIGMFSVTPNVPSVVPGRVVFSIDLRHHDAETVRRLAILVPDVCQQARGRCERMFRTLQDRLPKELALAGIADMEAANRFIADVFLPAYNARFAVAAAEPGSAFVPVGLTQWQDVLCVQEERVVGNDNTVAFQGLRLQIPPSRLRPHFV